MAKKKTQAGAPGVGRLSMNKNVKFDAQFGGKAGTNVSARRVSLKQGSAAGKEYKAAVKKKRTNMKKANAAAKKRKK